MAALLFSFCPAAPALDLRGEFFANYYHPAYPREDYDPNQFAEGVWAQAEGGEAAYKYNVSGSLTQITSSKIPGYADNRLVARFDEAYIQYSTSTTQVYVGRKTILWGRSDTINPTDFHTGTDMSVLNTETRLTRNSGTGIQLVYRPRYETIVCYKKSRGRCVDSELIEKTSPWSFDVAVTPYFGETRLLAGYAPLPEGVLVEKTERPGASFSNTEFGLRTAYTGKQYDFSLSGFRGFDHRPLFFETSRGLSGTTPVVHVTPKYVPVTAVGMDGSVEAVGSIFTLEAAYYMPSPTEIGTSVIPSNHLDGVLGVDYELFDNFHAILQGIFYYFPNLIENQRDSDAVRSQIRQTNFLLARGQKRLQTGNSLHLLYDDPELRHKLDIMLVKFYSTGDGYFQPKYTFKWTDEFQVSLGAVYFFGALNTTLGSLHDLSSGFLEIKYLF